MTGIKNLQQVTNWTLRDWSMWVLECENVALSKILNAQVFWEILFNSPWLGGGELGGLGGAALAPYVSHWGAFEKAVLLWIPKGHVPRSQVSSSPWTNSNFNVPTWRRVNSLPANLILGKMPVFFQAAVRINFNVIPQGNQREEKTGNKGRIVATEKKNVLKKKKDNYAQEDTTKRSWELRDLKLRSGCLLWSQACKPQTSFNVQHLIMQT